MAKKTDNATLRMVAEVVICMAEYMGPDFDQHKTGLDFLRAMKLDAGFRRRLEEAHRRLRARAATTLPAELLVPLRPVLVELRQACADVLNPEAGPDELARRLAAPVRGRSTGHAGRRSAASVGRRPVRRHAQGDFRHGHAQEAEEPAGGSEAALSLSKKAASAGQATVALGDSRGGS